MSAFFINTEGEKIERTKCQIFTRVMWYYRPVDNFNTWKKSEFYSRKYFKESCCNDNINFINEYSC